MTAPAEDGRTKPEVQFAQVPLDVLHAVCIELGGTRGAVLASVLAARYGVAKAHEASVNRKAVAAATGARPGAVRMAINRLRSANILIPSEDGFRFNPRPSQWTAIGPDKARNIRRLALPKASRHGDTASRHGDAHLEKRHATVTPPSRHGDETSRPRDETSRHGDALLKREEIYTQKTLSQSARATPAESRSFPDPMPEPEPTPASTLHPKATPERRQAVIALADQAGGWGYEAGKELQLGADPDHLEEAIRRGVRSKARSWQYVARIADGFRVHGIDQPPSPLERGGYAGPRRYPIGSREARAQWWDTYEANCRAKGEEPGMTRPEHCTWPTISEAVA